MRETCPCRWWKRAGSSLLLCSAVLSVFVLVSPARGSFEFRSSFVAAKVVRFWFHQQDGIQVWSILEPLNHQRAAQLWQKVHEHPYVQEVLEGLHGGRQLMLYHGLRKTFVDHQRYD